MKMISSTRMTSMKGVTLMSWLIGEIVVATVIEPDSHRAGSLFRRFAVALGGRCGGRGRG